MRLVNLAVQILIPTIISILGAYLGGLFDSNNKITIYWVCGVLLIGFINTYIASKLYKCQDDLDIANDKISRLLIKKEIKSTGFDLTIFPKVIGDRFQINTRHNMQIYINAVHPTTKLPSLEIKSNKNININVNNTNINSTNHLRKFIYLIPDNFLTNLYSSKRFFLYDLEIEPHDRGILELTIIAESEEFKTELTYNLNCI